VTITSVRLLRSPRNIIDATTRITQKIILFVNIAIQTLANTAKTIRTQKKSELPTFNIAISHQVFLKRAPDSLIASIGHLPCTIIIGKAKKVSIDHDPPRIRIIIFPMNEPSLNFDSMILSMRDTVAETRDH
jgi:hypothetical protein